MAARSLGTPPLPKDTDKSRSYHRSQILNLEVLLKETFSKHQRCPDRSRIRSCFQALDEILPSLGNYKNIMTTIRNEFYDSIYSKKLTSCELEPFVERVPFFCTAGRVEEARQEEAEKASESLAELQQKVRFRDHDLQLLYRKNLALKEQVTDANHKMSLLLEKIKTLEDLCHKQELEKGEMTYYQGSQEDSFRREIEKLQTTLAQKNGLIEKLTLFKTAYNDVRDGTHEEKEKNKTELIIDSVGMVEYDIYQAERLQKQFSELLNFQLDDFEMSLGQLRKKKEVLATAIISETEREASFALETHEVVAGFRKRISDLLEEQRLLRAHTRNLKHVFETYTTESKTVQRTADKALRCYGSVLQVSEDNAITFKSVRQFEYCGKCGDRVLESIISTIEVVPVKPHVTHVRLIRPGLKLRTNSKLGEPACSKSAFDDSDEEYYEGEDEQLLVSKTMKKIWAEFYDKQNGYKPKFTRLFNVNRTLDYIQEIYDARGVYEEKIEEAATRDPELTFMTFKDFFYDFFKQRYQIDEVAMKAVHDLLTAIAKFEGENLHIAIFIRHLCGLEDVAWKYISDIKHLLAKYNDGSPFTSFKYRQIVNILYPSRPRELNEQLELEYTAFTKNKYSLDLVEQHLLHMIYKQIEPNVKFFSLCLQRYDYQGTGVLQMEDFEDAMTTILPGTSGTQRRLLYRVAESEEAHDQVPINRLAMAAAYICVHESYLHTWAPQNINAPEVVSMLGRAAEPSVNIEGGAGTTAAGGIPAVGSRPEAAGGERRSQDEVDSLLRSDIAVQGLLLDPTAVEEEERKMKMRVDLAMKAQGLDDE